MRPLGLAALLIVLTATPSLAEWSRESWINTNASNAVNDQASPTAIPDGSGGIILTWRDVRSNNNDVYAQRLDANGVLLWGASGVAVCTNSASQEYPVVCADGSGGVIIAWADYRNGNHDVYAQRLNSAGTAQWTANGVPVVVATGAQQYPVILADGTGGAYVVWRDSRNGNYDLFAQRLTSAGVQSWGATGVEIVVAAGEQYNPLLALNAFGSMVVTWTDNRSGNGDVYAQLAGPGAGVGWTANGVAICTAVNLQYPTAIVSDGAYTTFVVWTDLRNDAAASWDIYAQAIRLTGSTLWGTNGLAVCTNAAQQREPTLVADEAGGVFVAWNDTRSGSRNDLYGQHLTGGGGALWTADGIALVTGGLYRQYPAGIADGAGGFLLAWLDSRGGTSTSDVLAQRFSSGGTPQWTSGGVGLMTNAVDTYPFGIVPDGRGGVVAYGAETRTGSSDVFVQRADHYGYLGSTSPVITAVRDVPADQGGQVKLSFSGPYIEDEPWFAFSTYRIYRSVSPQSLASRAMPATLTRDPDAAEADPSRVLYVTSSATTDYYWEFLSSVAVDYLGDYSVLAATAYDSTALGNPRTAFMVQGRSGTKHWDSAPDSGWSVDNLAPLAPAPFTGQFAGGATALHWDPNAEADLAGYRLYRGVTPGFPADAAHLVAELPDTGYVDAAGAPFYYKLVAVDVHGNVSPAALLLPAGTLGVDEPPAPVLALAPPAPSPARGEATLAFTLPQAGRATLSLHDVAGRRVVLLLDATLGPGEHRAAHPLVDDGGRPLGPGLYWIRLETPWGTRLSRIVVLR